MKFEEMINKVIHGDCMDVMKDIPDNSVDLILTDPPYGINYKSGFSNRNRIINDDFESWEKSLPLWMKEFKRVLTDTGVCCCCCGGGGKTPVTAIFTMEAIKFFYLIQTLVWEKFIGLGWRYRPAYENIIVLSKSKDNYNFYDDSKKISNLIKGINQDIPNKNEHPTQKPVKLMERLIRTHVKKEHLILDPFCGGGSTLVACMNMGNRFIGIEICKEYYDIANEKILKEQKQLKIW